MRPLAIHTAPKRTATIWEPGTVTVDELAAWMSSPADHKECGGYVLGTLRDNRRDGGHVVSRSALTLDVDHDAPADLPERVAALGCLALMHTTYRSTLAEPRWRVIVPLAQDIPAGQYRTAVDALAEELGLTWQQADDTGRNPVQFMWKPGTADLATYEHHTFAGEPLDPTVWLAQVPPEATTDPTPAVVLSQDSEDGTEDYSALPAHAQRVADEECAATVARWTALLADAQDWPEGQTDDHWRGWDKLVADAAREFAVLGAASWTAWSAADAEAEFRDALPDAMADAVADKWRREWKRATSGATPPRPRPLSAEEDFGPVEVPAAPAPQPAAATGSSWQPVDLTRVVQGLADGTLQRPAPTVGLLDDGRGLFYPGKVNGLAGESGSGKTWTALLVCRQLLEAGQAVVYIDHEDDSAGVVGRLLALGVAPGTIADLFLYLNPDQRATPADVRQLVSLVEQVRPALVVVDSTGEGLALEGANPNADEEVAAWFLRLPRPLAQVTYDGTPGPAVLLLDHITKADPTGLWPVGSQRKRAAISGAQYMQRPVTAFSQDAAGKAVLVCAKDRHGTYAQGKRVAELQVQPGPVMTLHAVASEAPHNWQPTALMERVSLFLEEFSPASQHAIQQGVTGKKSTVVEATRLLVEQGYVKRSKGARGALEHESIKPYRQPVTMEAAQCFAS